MGITSWADIGPMASTKRLKLSEPSSAAVSRVFLSAEPEPEKKRSAPFENFMLCLVDRSGPLDSSSRSVCALTYDMRRKRDQAEFPNNNGTHYNTPKSFGAHLFLRSSLAKQTTITGKLHLALFSKTTRTMLAVGIRPLTEPPTSNSQMSFLLLDDHAGCISADLTWVKSSNDEWILIGLDISKKKK